MQHMTWTELRDKINNMSEEQRNTDVTFFDSNEGEFFALCRLNFTSEDDVLDKNHPYLEVLD